MKSRLQSTFVTLSYKVYLRFFGRGSDLFQVPERIVEYPFAVESAMRLPKGSTVSIHTGHPGEMCIQGPGLVNEGLYHFAILLPDRADLGRFVSRLAQANTQAGAANHLVSESLYLQIRSTCLPVACWGPRQTRDSAPQTGPGRCAGRIREPRVLAHARSPQRAATLVRGHLSRRPVRLG